MSRNPGEKAIWPRLLALGIGVYLVWLLVGGIWEIRRAYLRIEEARVVLASEEAKKAQLLRQMEEVKTKEYLEGIARNDLNMQKEGETVVVLPATSSRLTAVGDRPNEEEKTNWEKWWRLVR